MGHTTILVLAVTLAAFVDGAPAPDAASVRADRPPTNLRCGGHCLYVALKSLGFEVRDYAALEAKLGQPGRLGYSMDELAKAAQGYGASVEGVETTVEGLEGRPGRFACIALLDRGHFVNVYDVEGDEVHLADPPGLRTVSRASFGAIWGGKALLLSDRPIVAEDTLAARRVRRAWLAYGCAGLLFSTAVVAGVRYARRSTRR